MDEISNGSAPIPGIEDFSDCEFCHEIWRLFKDPNPTTSADFVTDFDLFQEATSSKCTRHKPLFEEAAKRYGWPISKDVGIQEGTGERDSSVGSLSSEAFLEHLLLVRRDSVPEHPGIGRILDTNWVDLEILKKWKTKCLSSHGSKCENPMKVSPMRPAWVIDVKNKCVVPGNQCSSFVALSYMWGESTRFKVDARMMENLQEHNSLESAAISPRLTPMIRHAMHLTSAISERYLWVDALCFVHGDDESTEEQLNLMGAIYANAVITIIAADGDSSEGLPGLEKISAPRLFEQRIIPFGKEQIIVRNTGTWDMMSGGTEYYERGWVYQELMMSKRQILFNSNEIHWQCQCNVWHEELILGAEVDKCNDPRMELISSGFPDMASLDDILAKYNQTTLTYQEDALPGISGLLSIFSRTFTGGFLYGLPEMFFDRALCWKPKNNEATLERRIPSDRPTESRISRSILPSWSWIGWHGELSWGWKDGSQSADGIFQSEKIPITEWYTSNSLSELPRRRIRATWYENLDTFKDISNPLPTGWTRTEPAVDGDLIWPDGCDTYVFKHRNMPDGVFQNYYYPFPVPEIDESTPTCTPVQTQYIFCETKRARLFAYQPSVPEDSEDSEDHVVQIRTGSVVPDLLEDPGDPEDHVVQLGTGSVVPDLSEDPEHPEDHVLPLRIASVVPDLSEDSEDPEDHVVQLRTASGESAGSLHLHNKSQVNLFPWGSFYENTPSFEFLGKTVELVAICRTRYKEKRRNRENFTWIDPGQTKDVYNVLWIEWKDGVAYRLAIGEVRKEIWEGLELEAISLVLG